MDSISREWVLRQLLQLSRETINRIVVEEEEEPDQETKPEFVWDKDIYQARKKAEEFSKDTDPPSDETWRDREPLL